MFVESETFRSLLQYRAHWEFELFVGFIEMVVFDVVIGAILWPLVRKHWQHHITREKREGL